MSAEDETLGGHKAVVLLIEDEVQVRRFIRAGLHGHDFELIEAESGRQGIALAAQRAPDVVLLDLGLPDIDGIDVIRQIREWSLMPVIVLSAREREVDKVQALDAGADDYVTKPFAFGELLARVRVALRHARRTERGEMSVFECGDLTIDLVARRVSKRGQPVHLTPIEYKLLTTLAKHAGMVVTHRALLESVWGRGSGERTQYLRVHMTHVRRKIEDDPAVPKLVVTVSGVGYRFEC